jgi:hypothetical protein
MTATRYKLSHKPEAPDDALSETRRQSGLYSAEAAKAYMRQLLD